MLSLATRGILQEPGEGGGGGDVDATPPEVAVAPGSLAPGLVAGDYASVRHSELVLDVTDDRGLAYVAVFASFAGSAKQEPVFRRGSFEPGFTVASWVEEYDDNVHRGVRLHVRRDGGWPRGAVSLTVDPVDGGGNVGA